MRPPQTNRAPAEAYAQASLLEAVASTGFTLPVATASLLFLELDPDSVWTPITATFVFTPPISIVVGEPPIVAIHMKAPFGLVSVLLFGMPAVTARVADDGGRSAGRSEGQRTGA
jgi:hypothetical protein